MKTIYLAQLQIDEGGTIGKKKLEILSLKSFFYDLFFIYFFEKLENQKNITKASIEISAPSVRVSFAPI